MSSCVVFRVDANPTIGLGHLMRSLAVAQGLYREGIKLVFAITDSTQHYCQSRQDWVGEVHILPTTSKQVELASLSSLCHNVEAKWLILDGYDFDCEYRNELNKIGCKLGIFDDGLLCKSQSVEPNLNLLINWSTGAEHLPYDKYAPNAYLCVGDSYRVLREEFYQSELEFYEHRKSLLLMFGGSDPFKFTLPLLQELAALQADMPITVVTGAGYQALPQLIAFIQASSLSVSHHHDSQNIAQLMGKARLAISAAGASQFELLTCLTPSVLVIVAENQVFASQQAKEQGWCELVGSHNVEAKSLIKGIAQSAVNLWENSAKLNFMHQNTKIHSNLSGIQKIIKAMF
ncbi:UDP-2,4-diacetamido-2,4,6-trideoxy-beta-L-altropyranose hydrolase [Paraglaciecola sp. 2405UD69-4]|uniref:UDP-2,4-diacetamido-2,4, 6-trideoxy-beta-L-altropyranose hydrolase n=1 Tax=Paraglaciecola sp. 2405UD69-4 TaxID=3391836 RepID=UPI0039C92A8B